MLIIARNFPWSPLAMMTSFWKHRHLIWQLTQRDVIGRYRGSVMGILWSLLHPILMLLVYTFVFSVVFKARWVGGSNSKTEFAIVLFVGLIVHALFAECINRAPSLILSNVNYVKRVVFPLEILPLVTLGSAFFHAVISIGVLLLFFFLVNGSLHWTVIFLPLVLLPLVLLTMGGAWLLASLGVYIRDVGQTIGIVTTVMLFLSPVFYPVAALPADYQFLLFLNPLTFPIEQSRELVVWGRPPDWAGLGIYTVFAFMAAFAGFAWFQKTRRGFADVV